MSTISCCLWVRSTGLTVLIVLAMMLVLWLLLVLLVLVGPVRWATAIFARTPPVHSTAFISRLWKIIGGGGVGGRCLLFHFIRSAPLLLLL